MKLSLVNEGLFKVKIDVSKFFNAKSGEFILTFREVNEEEQLKMIKAENKKEEYEVLSKIWKECLIDWTLENDDGVKSAKKDVIEILQKSSGAVTFIVKEFFGQLPLVRMNAGSLDKLPELCLKAEQ